MDNFDWDDDDQCEPEAPSWEILEHLVTWEGCPVYCGPGPAREGEVPFRWLEKWLGFGLAIVLTQALRREDPPVWLIRLMYDRRQRRGPHA
ncbi:MAG TPA: hypothetical protein VNO81_10425 [Candidatus Nitrosotenuis sp.]|nr:hypothetical protein [Candidatus Nitrosotenuis sp.]